MAPCSTASGVISCMGRSVGRLHLLSTGLGSSSGLTCLQARYHWSEYCKFEVCQETMLMNVTA